METTTIVNKLPAPFTAGFFKLYLKGIGQVMFQANALTGLFFLAGIFYGAYAAHTPTVAWGAVVGAFISTLTGYVLRYPAQKGVEGLWGFNGVLIGCALPTFLGDTPLVGLTIIVFSAMTTWVMVGLNNVLKPYKVSSFTFPFVLTTWFVLLAARTFYALPTDGLGLPDLPYASVTALDTRFTSLLVYWLRGISQVFLINSWVTGLLFLIGLFISSPRAAAWAAIGSAGALGVAILFGGNAGDITNGLFGFSPVLTAIALGSTFYSANIRTALWTLAGIFATVFIQAAMDTFFAPVGIPTLTAPFCVATWLFLLPHLNLNKKTLQQG